VNRAERRERLSPVVHAITGVGLISQGLGNIGAPSSSRLLGVTSAARGTHYIQYAWFLAAAVLIGVAVLKLRRVRNGVA